jgi:WD40 repeat protein
MPFEEVFRFDAHPESINQIVFSPKGDILVTTGSDQEVKFWSIP